MGKPSIFIIGGRKCGTTFLYYTLCTHPKINQASRKEIDYYNLHYEKGLEWYKSQFPSGISIDATAGYMHLAHIPYRIKKDFDDPLIVCLVRNPVDRAYSFYHHNVRHKIEKDSFFNAIRKEPFRLTKKSYYYLSYLNEGLYASHLYSWMNLFKRVMVIKSEDMFKHPQKYLTKIFKEISVNDIKIDIKKAMSILKGKRTENAPVKKYNVMKPYMKKRLDEFFELPNKKLKELCGVSW